MDNWLVCQMTRGQLHITVAFNAARTMLYNIHKRTWDTTLLEAMQLPREILPEVCPSSHVYGLTNPAAMLDVESPIASIAGDQQAA